MSLVIPPRNVKQPLTPEQESARALALEAERKAKAARELERERKQAQVAEQKAILARKAATKKREAVREAYDKSVAVQQRYLPPEEQRKLETERIETLAPSQRLRHTLHQAGVRGSAPKKALPDDDIGLALFYNLMLSERGMKLPPHLEIVNAALADKRINNLLIIVGPGSGKSQFLSTVFPSFVIGQDPTMTCLGISAAENLMQGFQSGVMEWIEFSPIWKQLFPGVSPDKDRGWSNERGMFVKGHGKGDPDANYFAAGLASKALTGKHARLIIGDDMHSEENSNSADACMKVRETYYKQIMGRADPRGARFVFAGRRWHEEDLYGHLKLTGDWVVMELPALREKSREVYWDVTVPEDLICVFNEPVDAPPLPVDLQKPAEKGKVGVL